MARQGERREKDSSSRGRPQGAVTFEQFELRIAKELVLIFFWKRVRGMRLG